MPAQNGVWPRPVRRDNRSMPDKPIANNAQRHVRASDLRAAVQLATQATQGVTRIVEGVHQSVHASMGVGAGPVAGQTRGITGLVYKGVHGVTRAVGKGLDLALAGMVRPPASEDAHLPGSTQREAVLAILNGVMGDHLLASRNSLATSMSLRHGGQPMFWGAEANSVQAMGICSRVLLMVHGLCMNDLQWSTERGGQAVNHGEAVASALGYTPIYLRYNTGLHISQNGRLLAAQLEQLALHWPMPLEEISVLAHSMGGLVIRSAVQVARAMGLSWPLHLKRIVFLGTPHHGSPLERAGNWVDTIVGSTPFTAPFARLSQLRSAGITDLRWGHVLDVDWQGEDRFRRKPDSRAPLPLPEGVACYAIAATLASERSALSDRLTGDGLVPLRSALGQHDDPDRTLGFANDSQWVACNMGHLELLSRPEVTQQILKWLAVPSRGYMEGKPPAALTSHPGGECAPAVP